MKIALLLLLMTAPALAYRNESNEEWAERKNQEELDREIQQKIDQANQLVERQNLEERFRQQEEIAKPNEIETDRTAPRMDQEIKY